MRHLIFLVMLSGCSFDHDVSGEIDTEVTGEIDNTISVDYIDAELKQVDGIIYIRTEISGLTIDCIALDFSTIYPDEWSSLTKADESRQTDYTYAEIMNCEDSTNHSSDINF